jgi:hypothetical protein
MGRSGHFGREVNPLTLPAVEPRYLRFPARSVVMQDYDMALSAYQEREVKRIVKKTKLRMLHRMRSSNIAMELRVRR